jgi:phage-related protein
LQIGCRCGAATCAPGEVRIRDAAGSFRIIYLATLADRVLVLHAFQKKTQHTTQRDIELAAKRLREWKRQQ